MNAEIRTNIIILNYNNSEDTIECLDSILKSECLSFRVIVVDNASTDNSCEDLLEWFNINLTKKTFTYFVEGNYTSKNIEMSDFVFIKSPENNGYAAGNNIALRVLQNLGSKEYVWILNNDTIVFPDTLRKLLDAMNKLNHHSKVGFIGSHILYYDDKSLSQSAGYFNKVLWKREEIVKDYRLMRNGIYEVDDLSGCSLFFSMNIIESIGLIPEEYFLYFEETDWIYNAKLCGFKHFVNTDSRICHKEARSTGGVHSPFVLYYMTRNKLNFVRKNYSKYYIVYSLFFTFRNLIKAALFGFKSNKVAKSIVKGLYDGLTHIKGKQ